MTQEERQQAINDFRNELISVDEFLALFGDVNHTIIVKEKDWAI